MQSPLPQKLLRHIKSHKLIPEGATLLLAVSGGADSVALLRLFHDYLASPLKLKLKAAHLNHGWRGKDSDLDETFTRQLCRKLKIPLTVSRRRIKTPPGESAEAVARTARYGFLEQAADKSGADFIVTAHHRDDQAETVLMRMLTGTGLEGLCGIRPLQGRLVRPLLTVGKEELVAYLKEAGQPFRTDKSNADIRFFRNRIRHRILPVLVKEAGPHVPAVLARLADNALDELASLPHGQTMIGNKKRVSIPLHELYPLSQSDLRHRLVRETSQLEIPPFFRKTLLEQLYNHIKGKSGSGIDLDKGLRAWKESGHLIIAPRPRLTSIPLFAFPLKNGFYRVAKGGLTVTVSSKKPDAHSPFPSATADTAWLDWDKLAPRLELRSRKDGDRFVPLGAPGEKKLKHFLINQKIPVLDRSHIPVLLSAGKVAWVKGFRISDDYKITPATRKVAMVKVSI